MVKTKRFTLRLSLCLCGRIFHKIQMTFTSGCSVLSCGARPLGWRRRSETAGLYGPDRLYRFSSPQWRRRGARGFRCWLGLLHETDHVVSDSEDAQDKDAVGECEDHINSMRLELGLPVRPDYFFNRAYLKSRCKLQRRYVRLSFERRDKRYWLIWDATTVGGLIAEGQRALVR